MRREPSELERGRTIGRYQLLVPAAIGGTSRVWAARRRDAVGFEELVALRPLCTAGSDARDYERKLLLEARLASRIQHPNVAEHVDVVRYGDFSCLVSEWIEGQSLDELLLETSRERRIPLGVAVQIVVQACQALRAVHELRGPDRRALGWVHGEVSPRKLMIDTSGVVKLVDLGIVENHPTEARKSDDSFVAPELARGERVDLRADVFSLGVILYLLTTGRRPFASAPGFERTAVMFGNVPALPPSAVVPGYPKDLETVVRRALSRQRERRFRSTSELGEALVAAFPRLASQAELAELLHRLCGDSIARERMRLEQALERYAAADSVRAPTGTSLARNTLSPSYVTTTTLLPSNERSSKPGRVALLAGAFAFVAAFALTLVLPFFGLASRSTFAARTALPVATTPLPSVGAAAAPESQTEQPATRALLREVHVLPPSTPLPSAIPLKRAPVTGAPSSTPAKGHDANAVLRRYGI